MVFSTSSSFNILFCDAQIGSIIVSCCPRSWVPELPFRSKMVWGKPGKWYGNRYLWFSLRYGPVGGGVRQWGWWVIIWSIIQVLLHFVQFWAMARPGESAAGHKSAVWSIGGSIQKADSIRWRADSISALKQLIIGEKKSIFPRTAWPSNYLEDQ